MGLVISIKKRICSIWLTGFIIGAFCLPNTAWATIFFVDSVSGSDVADGLSWETAKQSISSIFEVPPEVGDEIRVAEGRYMEHVVMTDGVRLTGGYCAGEDQPDYDRYISIIDGNFTDRCVTGASNAILEGFTIVNGWSSHGSGVLHAGITMHVRHCIIRNCIAFGGNPQGGGAMHFYLSQSLIESCIFEENGVNLSPDSTSSESMGGAVLGWSSGPEFYRCQFLNNRVWVTPAQKMRLGGAMWFAASNPVIRECLFEGNSAISGGGAGWWNRCRPTVEDCIFRNNSATTIGGGICHSFNEKDEPEFAVFIRNTRFENNTADIGGGLAVLRKNRIVVENCLFSGNQASTSGTALSVNSDSICTISNCTFAHNSATGDDSETACINIDDTSFVTIKDSIVSDNESMYGIRLAQGGDPLHHHISDSNIHGHLHNYSPNLVDRTGWAGNLSVPPLFTGFHVEKYCLSEPQTQDPQQIQRGRSPCIDTAGYNTSGYPLGYASTRTDMIKDSLTADMGFHRYPDGIGCILDSPLAGAFAVDPDTQIQCRLIRVPETLTEDDLAFKLNGILLPGTLTAIPGGFLVEVTPPDGLNLNTGYWFESLVHIQSDIFSFKFTFSTGTAPNPDPPPEGNWLAISFPMTETMFRSGDYLDIRLESYNPWLNMISADLHIAFEFAGEYFIYPNWDFSIQPISKSIAPGAMNVQEVLAFEVPSGIGLIGPINFLAIATCPTTFGIMSDLAVWSMYFID